VCTIISQQAYSQYLVKNDIDIFIKNYDKLNNIISFYDPPAKDKKLWDDFRSAVTSLYQHIGNTDIYLTEPKSFEKRLFIYEHLYQDLINYKIPKELEEAFKNAGWKSNGNKKFWTICYGSALLSNMSELELFLGMIRDKTNTEYFSEEERELLEDEMEEIFVMTNTVATNISKLLAIINVNDKKIIEDRLNELVDVIE